MKITCDVIQDLMPSYVDEICSRDTRELVDGHVSGCDQCRARLEHMKNTGIVAEKASEKQVDYLKKIKSTISRKEWLGKFVLIALALVEVAGVFSGGNLINYTPGSALVFSILHLCAAGLAGNYIGSGRSKGAAVQLGISWLGLLLLIVTQEYFLHCLGVGKVPFLVDELYECGPIYANICRGIVLAEVVILFWNTFKKRNYAYVVIVNIISLSLTSYVKDSLHSMDSYVSMASATRRATIFQVCLLVLVSVVCFLYQNRKKFSR